MERLERGGFLCYADFLISNEFNVAYQKLLRLRLATTTIQRTEIHAKFTYKNNVNRSLHHLHAIKSIRETTFSSLLQYDPAH